MKSQSDDVPVAVLRRVICIMFSCLLLCGVLLAVSASACEHWRLELDALGNTLFFAGDRRFKVPSTTEELETEYCDRHLKVIDGLRNITHHCLTPYAKQVSGLLAFGFRKNIRRSCKDPALKKQLVQKFKCLRNESSKGILDSTMNSFILNLEFIRDNVSNSTLLLSQTCCAFYNYGKQKLESMFRSICQDDSIVYFVRMIELSLKDAQDLVCPNSKALCAALKADQRLAVPENLKRHASSALVPLFDILSKHESLSSCKYCSQ